MLDRVQRLIGVADAWLSRWWLTRVVRRAVTGYGEHGTGRVAAGMAYFAVLSLFQLAVLGIVAASLLVGEGEARRLFIDRLVTATPLAREMLEAIVDGVIAGRGGITVLSVVLLAWGSYGFFAALAEGIRIAIPGEGGRRFWHERASDLLVMIGAAGLAILAVVIGLVTGVLTHSLNQLVIDLIGLILPIAFVFLALLMLYMAVPDRPMPLRLAWPGALVGAVLWTALRLGFSWYATDVARYDELFGPISAAIGLLVFLYLASIAVLIGAEVARASVLEEFNTAGDL